MLTREEFFDAIDNLRACDGTTLRDLINRGALGFEIREYLDSIGKPSNLLLAYVYNRYPPDDSYGLAGVKEFIRWTETELGIYI